MDCQIKPHVSVIPSLIALGAIDHPWLVAFVHDLLLPNQALSSLSVLTDAVWTPQTKCLNSLYSLHEQLHLATPQVYGCAL